MTTKAELNALERVFSHEIEQVMNKPKVRLPYCSKAKIYQKLEAEGLVRRESVVVGSGWSAVKVEGWAQTTAGNLLYCMSCEDEATPTP